MIELYTQPYSPGTSLSTTRTHGTTQTSAFITQLMESSQSDHYRETVKKSLNYKHMKASVLIRSSFTYLLRNTYTDGFVQKNYESHIQHNRPGTTFLDMQRNAQMNLKDWMWINHLWLNYTDAEEREPHIITSHTVFPPPVSVCLQTVCLLLISSVPGLAPVPSRVWRGTWSACVSLPVPVCSLPVCRSDRSSSGSVSEGKPHLCHTSVRLPSWRRPRWPETRTNRTGSADRSSVWELRPLWENDGNISETLKLEYHERHD